MYNGAWRENDSDGQMARDFARIGVSNMTIPAFREAELYLRSKEGIKMSGDWYDEIFSCGEEKGDRDTSVRIARILAKNKDLSDDYIAESCHVSKETVKKLR